MKVRASTLDDLLNEVFARLIKSGQETNPTKGRAFEITGATLELTNPRARISRTEAREVFFSWLGECLWYLSGGDELSFIKYYLPKYKADFQGATHVRAAYGPRLRSNKKDQLRWVVEMIRSNRDTRRAVIPIYGIKDTRHNLSEVPCTCTLQFLLRQGRLTLITHMRSNDAFVGLPGDIFAFTMIQEIVARSLNVELGSYKHLVGSLHLYECSVQKAENYLAEGFQKKTMMPMMPLGDQFSNLERLLRFERATRLGKHPSMPADLPIYWQDISRLLAIFRAIKDKSSSSIRQLRKQMQSDAYTTYIENKQRTMEERTAMPVLDSNLLFEVNHADR